MLHLHDLAQFKFLSAIYVCKILLRVQISSDLTVLSETIRLNGGPPPDQKYANDSDLGLGDRS